MVDVTYPPTKRRRQIHDQGRVPTMQLPSIPCGPPPEPGQTKGYVILSGGVTSMSHLAGADGRQIRHVVVDLPSPPPEDEQFELLPSLNTAPFPPAATATWAQALPFTGVSPFGQPGESEACSFSRPGSSHYSSALGTSTPVDMPDGR